MVNNSKEISTEQTVLYVISLIILMLIIYTFIERNIPLAGISVFTFLVLIIIASINPKTIKNLTLKKDEMSFECHTYTEEEIKQSIDFVNRIEDFDIKDMNNNSLIKEAMKRTFKEKSDIDFLLLSTKLWRENKYEEALKEAYFGLYISNNNKVRSCLEARLSSIYLKLNQNKIALYLAKKACYTESNNPMAHLNLSSYYHEVGNLKKY